MPDVAAALAASSSVAVVAGTAVVPRRLAWPSLPSAVGRALWLSSAGSTLVGIVAVVASAVAVAAGDSMPRLIAVVVGSWGRG